MDGKVNSRMFGYACIATKWLHNGHVKDFLPAAPLALIVIVYCILHVWNCADGFCPIPVVENLGEHARMGISVATVMLGFAAATLLLVKQGVTPESRRKRIEDILQKDIKPELEIQFSNEGTTIADFIATSVQDAGNLWEAADQVQRYFHWSNIFGSMGIGVYATSMYLSFVRGWVELWTAGFHLFLTLLCVSLVHVFVAFVPAILDRYILRQLRGEIPRLRYQEFRAQFNKFKGFQLPADLR